MFKKKRRMSWDEYCRSLDAEVVELHPAVEKGDPYEKGYCEGFIKAWNAQAEIKNRTCKQEERGWATEGDHARVWLTCGHDCMVPTVQDLPNYCPNCGARVIEE